MKTLHRAAAALSLTSCFLLLSAFDLPSFFRPKDNAAENQNDFYPGNRPPLKPGAFIRLPFGSIRARGWLAEQMRLQARGLTGHLGEFFPDVGPRSAWLGGDGEAWERGPYYWRGLVALAYATDDVDMKAKALPWIEWALASQKPDGNFGPWRQDWWPKMIVCQALTWYQEATRDPRVIPFLERFFAYQSKRIGEEPLKEWAVFRGGDNIEPLLWLYNRNRDPALLRLARKLKGQTYDWTGLFWSGHPIEGGSFIEQRHGVNLAQGLKEPGLLFLLTGKKDYREAPLRGLALLDRFYGQAHGVYAGDEPVAPTSAFHGTELCTTVEFLHSSGVLFEALGDPSLADRMERAAFNALPAALLPDGKGYQYYIQPNTVSATRGMRGFPTDHGSNLTPGGISGYPCCAVNQHYAWPWVSQNLFMAAPGGGLAAVLYAPCEVKVRVGDGVELTLTVETGYPFLDRVSLTLKPERPVRFALWPRIPGWCRGARVLVNGEEQSRPSGGSFVKLEREWKAGDIVTLEFPMDLRLTRWEDQSVAVERGPLVFALKVGERWISVGPHEEMKGPVAADFPLWEIRPTTAWNMALVLDAADPSRSLQVVLKDAVPRQPFSPQGAPVWILARAREVKGWGLDPMGNANPPPTSPVATDAHAQAVTLVPFACTKLRVTYLPVAIK